MDRFRTDQGVSPVRQVEAYWTALRQDGEIPVRSKIDPRGLENILTYAFILERVAPGIARFRLAGSHLIGLAGMEVRGMPLTSFFTPAGRKIVGAATERMFEDPAVVQLDLLSEPRFARSSVEGQLVMLPLRSDLGDVSRALGVMVTDGRPNSGQSRFNITHTEIRQVFAEPAAAPASAFDLDTARDPQFAELGFAEEQVPLSRHDTSYLRLVVSRD